MPYRLNCSDGGFEDAFRTLLAAKREVAQDVNDTVRDILADVAARGDAALREYTARFDRADLRGAGFAFTSAEIETALDACPRKEVEALELAATRIEDFHRRQLPQDDSFTDSTGVELGHRWNAIGAAGMYVPGGVASYPSSVLMNAIPAKVAGVPRRVMVMPTPDGKFNPLCLAAARMAGVHEIYRIGGAQALAALAYGTRTILPVDKITGPGNAYVAAAKRQLFGVVGIDMIAGPSEILVVADAANDPDWIAADLLSQAEHDAAAQAILITDDAAFADAVAAAAARHLQSLPRAGIAGQSWERHGAIILVPALAEAVPLIDRIAPEHLELAVENPREMMAQIRNAGAIFLGRYTPEAIGDYIAGPNHVLPTARAARYASGLSVTDFMKRTTFIGCQPGALDVIGPPAIILAESEGLTAHARAIALRGNFSGGA
ncbi:MAG: histidinol dehydrogenase [Pseudomonadota bacterium]|jgi:histidinol dehydrogenase|nr:histidinol dehydrogenase [Alphaproteobacteria bacterium]